MSPSRGASPPAPCPTTWPAVCNVAWGQEIGYQTGLDSNKSPATTLLYLTDGVQMVQRDPGQPRLRRAGARRDPRMEPEPGGAGRPGQEEPGQRLLPAQRQARRDHERHAQGQADIGFPEPRPGDHRPRPRLPGRLPAAPSLLSPARRRHPARRRGTTS